MEYSKITGTVYTKLVHPGELEIEENTTLYDAITLQELHNENLHAFRATSDVEAVLKSQIIAVINPMYLKELKNNMTETSTFTNPNIFTYLFQEYRKVSSQQLHEKQQKIHDISYNINNPPIIIFNAIENISNLATAANLEKYQ